MNLKRPWSSEEDYRLRVLLESGASVMLISAKLKRSSSAVRARAASAGISINETKRLNAMRKHALTQAKR